MECASNKLSIFPDGAALRCTSSKVSIFLDNAASILFAWPVGCQYFGRRWMRSMESTINKLSIFPDGAASRRTSYKVPIFLDNIASILLAWLVGCQYFGMKREGSM